MTSVLGQFANGPIQFNSGTGAIEQRGTIDTPSASATGAGTASIMSKPDTTASVAGGGVQTAQPTGTDNNTGANVNLDNSTGTYRNIGGTTYAGTPAVGGGRSFDSGADINGQNAGWDANISGGGGALASAADKTFTLPAMLSYDDGGTVDSGADTSDATVDPMSFIKQAITYGRKQMGLPTNFSTGETESAMGFDDGGVVPMGGDNGGGDEGVTGGGNGAVDPRQTMRYLTGDGAVSSEIATALERHVDPQGQMDPAARTLAAIQMAPSDEAKFGMLQRYRMLYNGLSAGARAAMSKGNLGQAAMLATQAFDRTPTGYKVHFAPTQGGMMVSARKLGGNQQQAQSQSFDDGGSVSKYDQLPSSDNIDDRRDEPEENKKPEPKTFGSAMRKLGDAAADGAADWGRFLHLDNPSELAKQAGYKDMGSVGVLGFDDGGEVPDDNLVPQSDMQEPVEPTEPEMPAQGESSEPQMLSTDQFNALMSAGYDKPLDEGWTGLIKNLFRGQTPENLAPGEQMTMYQSPDTSALDSRQWGLGSDASKSPLAAQAGLNDIEPQAQQPYLAAKGGALEGAAAGVSGKKYSTLDAAPQVAPRTATLTASNLRRDEINNNFDAYQQAYERANKLSARLYPAVSQQAQREQFVNKYLETVMGSDEKIRQNQSNPLWALRQTQEENKNTRAANTEAGKDRRAADAHQTHWDIAQLQAATRRWTTAQQEVGKQFGRLIAANPSFAKNPDAAWATAQQLAKKNGLDPTTLMQVGLHFSGRGQQAQQSQDTTAFVPPPNWQKSNSRQQYRDPQGHIYDLDGNPVR